MERDNVHFDVGNTDDHIFKLIVFPRISRAFNHSKRRIVLTVIRWYISPRMIENLRIHHT